MEVPRQLSFSLRGPMSNLVVLLSDGVGCKLWYRLGGITVTSAPVSNLNSANSPFNETLAFHEPPVLPCAAYSSVSSPGKNFSSSSCLPGTFTSPTLLSDWDLQAIAQCPTLEHLSHFDSLAGHSLFGCGWPRHLEYCASGVFPFLDFGGFFFFFLSSLEFFPFHWTNGQHELVVGQILFPVGTFAAFQLSLTAWFFNCFL